MNRLIVLICCFVLIGCTHFHVYRPTIEQGNIVTDEMISRLHTGMTKRQVQNVMGTPLVQTTFSENRFNYVYAFKSSAAKRMTQKRITLIFEKGLLSKIEKEGY